MGTERVVTALMGEGVNVNDAFGDIRDMGCLPRLMKRGGGVVDNGEGVSRSGGIQSYLSIDAVEFGCGSGSHFFVILFIVAFV